jgi:hypothetical protein
LKVALLFKKGVSTNIIYFLFCTDIGISQRLLLFITLGVLLTLYTRDQPITFVLEGLERLGDLVGLAFHHIPLVLNIQEGQEDPCSLVVLGIPLGVGVVRKGGGCLELVVEV